MCARELQDARGRCLVETDMRRNGRLNYPTAQSAMAALRSLLVWAAALLFSMSRLLLSFVAVPFPVAVVFGFDLSILLVVVMFPFAKFVAAAVVAITKEGRFAASEATPLPPSKRGPCQWVRVQGIL